MSNPFFSVIVPAYNAENHIRKLLDSITRQTFTDYELIVICDNCTDTTEQIAKEYGAITESVSFGRDGLTRDRGLELAHGQWILFADDDDWFTNDSCFSQLADFIGTQDDTVDLIAFGYDCKGKGYVAPLARSVFKPRVDHVWSSCWRRERIGDARFGDAVFCSDTYFLKAMKPHVRRFELLNVSIYYYNFRRPGSQTDLFCKGILRSSPVAEQEVKKVDRLAVYAGTRNLYHDMVVAAKSLIYNRGADRVVFLIEDDTFPEQLPPCVTTMNVSNQTFFSPSGPNFKSRWTYMVMMRTALAKLFPDVDRIMSLDHDTIIHKPIDFLWNLNISDYYFAAVEEKQIQTRPHPYFNFGVVMHNLAKLRADAMDDKIISLINTKYFGYCEQDAVNELCSKHIMPVPPEYNAYFFQVPRVPDADVIIRHYAACGDQLRTQDDYKSFNSMTWSQALTRTGVNIPACNQVSRHDIINSFIEERGYKSFLEIGTDTGVSFRKVKAKSITSVDPDTRTPATHHAASDAFFAACTDKYDIIFIDGLHECNQVYRDIINALYHLNPGGVIVLHDCLPTTEQMQRHALSYPGGAWTGDVWKAFVKARADLPYLMYTVDTDFGCGVIDTTQNATAESKRALPSDMETMTYNQFVRNRNEWMNVKEGIQHG